jgi:RNA polymerase sigma-70 factor (ECF subfamily)
MVTAANVVLGPGAASVATPERLRTFVDTHYERLWRVVRRLGVPHEAAEDAVQEVLVILSRRLAEVAPAAEWSFAVGTARRVAADLRRKHATAKRGLAEASLVAAVNPAPYRDITVADERQLLDRLLDQLPDEQREAIVLVELAGMTMAEAALALGVPGGTIASRLRRGRAHLETAVRELRDEHQGCWPG